jgi:integrase
LDMVTGLRRGELAGLRWSDIDFGEDDYQSYSGE